MINRKRSLFPSITAPETTSSLQGGKERHRKKLSRTLWVSLKILSVCAAFFVAVCYGTRDRGKDADPAINKRSPVDQAHQETIERHKKHKESHEAPIGTLAFKEGRQEFLRQQYRLRKRDKTKNV